MTGHEKGGGGVDPMKQAEDQFTPDLLTDHRRPGRPRKPDALTPAQRARAYRERKRRNPAPRPTTGRPSSADLTKAANAISIYTEIDPDSVWLVLDALWTIHGGSLVKMLEISGRE